MDFGLSRLEAIAYIALLREPGITGYRLSHILDKPTANIYKALKSLETKGLVTMDKSDKARTIHPVAIEEYLRAQEVLFRIRSRELQQSLKHLEEKKSNYQISRLGSYEQAIGKAVQIIENAESVIVIVAFAEVLSELEEAIARKIDDGINVIIYTYSPFQLKGCRIFYSERDAALWTAIPERAFDIAADGNVFMISNFRNNYSEVIEALYGNHIYLSLMIFNSLSKNILIEDMTEGDFFSEEAKREIREYLSQHRALLVENLPGVEAFFKRHGVAL